MGSYGIINDILRASLRYSVISVKVNQYTWKDKNFPSERASVSSSAGAGRHEALLLSGPLGSIYTALTPGKICR
ncbi:hypothetical protein CI238_12975 [Colletotrichum incanum]|uniref:Uncharacterized protein n=1 Tax=Colletotrichum incanum TaxID=1573173 RepID=A0A161Y3C6_COLIC|nr:hypothetical protein CI238_12975 [Colletotrichum incanum]